MAADNAGLLEFLEESTSFNPKSGFSRAEAVEVLSKTTLGEDRVSAFFDPNSNENDPNFAKFTR